MRRYLPTSGGLPGTHLGNTQSLVQPLFFHFLITALLPSKRPDSPSQRRTATLASPHPALIMSGGNSGSGGDATLFEESFTVTDYDQSKYDRVARISCTSTDSQTVMVLDINIELFPCNVSDSLHVVLTTTLSPDGTKEDDKGWRDVGKGGDAPATIADLYDYVCHGKIYKFEETYDGNTMCAQPLTSTSHRRSANRWTRAATHTSRSAVSSCRFRVP